jgi:hypothetical protein
MNNDTFKPLIWTEPQIPNDEIVYTHVIAHTPFGRILITWKSWKDHPSFTVDEHPSIDFFCCAFSLEEAKERAEKDYFISLQKAINE